jgi:hypothetical protein
LTFAPPVIFLEELRSFGLCFIIFVLLPIMMPVTQLVHKFSLIHNDPRSGRTTPSSVGGEVSGRFSVSTVNSSNAGSNTVSFDTQQGLSNMVCPIASRGSLFVLNPDLLL